MTVDSADEGRPIERPSQGADHSKRSAEFAAFYRDFTPRLVAFLIHLGANPADAAEVCQEAMTRAWKHWADIEHPEAWTRTVASRAWTRRLATIDEDPVAEVSEFASPLLGATPSELAEWVQRQETIQLLSGLPPRQRQVMAWTLEGFTPTEVAAQLQTTPEAVRSSLAKARRTIARRLNEASG